MPDIPNPGSTDALRQGCVCAVLDNNRGTRPPFPPDGWYLNTVCPVHRPWLKDAPVTVTRRDDVPGYRGPSQQMEVRADRVCVGDLAWLPQGVSGEAWELIRSVTLEGNEDVVFNGHTTTSMGNGVVVSREIREVN